MPGVFRPYTLTDVLAGMADQNGQQSVDTTTSGLGFFAEADEALLAATGIARGPISSFSTTGHNTATLTWSPNPAAGSTIIVVVQTFAETYTNVSVQDNGSTVSFFAVDLQLNANGQVVAIFRADEITLPETGQYTVTVSGTGTGTVVAGGMSYTGLASGGPVATNTGTSAGSTSVSTGSVTGVAGGLYVCGFSDGSGLVNESITLTNPAFVQQFVETNGNNSNAGAIADQIAAAAGPQACTWTLGDTVPWTAGIATYAPAASIDTATATVQPPTGWDGGEWNQLEWEALLQNYLGVFGDGSDGAVTLDGVTSYPGFSSLSGSTYTLTRDVYATQITVNAGVTLKPRNYRIYCQGTLTNNGNIFNNGNNATGTNQSSGGGAVGSGSYGGGRAGANGGTGAGSAPGSVGNDFGSVASGGSGSGGAGGTGNPLVSLATAVAFLHTPVAALGGSLQLNLNNAQFSIAGGCSGGGDGTNAGGGGGGGAGLVVIFAYAVVNAGVIECNGGSGGTPTTGNCGGGGGGSGGLILIYTLAAWTNTGTTPVNGGAAGSGVGTGVAGTAGTVGQVLNVVLS